MKRSKIFAWLIIPVAFLGCAEEPLVDGCYIQDITAAYLSHTKNAPDYLNNYTIKLERIAGETISPEFEEIIVDFGDGEVAVMSPNRERLSENQYLWTYETQHTYPASGEFDIAVYKNSWGEIAEESHDEPFITNKLVIEPRLGRNAIAKANFSQANSDEGCIYAIGIEDAEGDSIAFDIVSHSGKAAYTIISRDSLVVETRGLNAEFTVSINEYRINRHLGYTQLKVAKETPNIEEQ